MILKKMNERITDS